MFAVLEKGEHKTPVYSTDDMKYLMARGWKLVIQGQANEPVANVAEPEIKRRGRPKKDK